MEDLNDRLCSGGLAEVDRGSWSGGGCQGQLQQGLGSALVDRALVVDVYLHDGHEAVKEFHLLAAECMD